MLCFRAFVLHEKQQKGQKILWPGESPGAGVAIHSFGQQIVIECLFYMLVGTELNKILSGSPVFQRGKDNKQIADWNMKSDQARSGQEAQQGVETECKCWSWGYREGCYGKSVGGWGLWVAENSCPGCSLGPRGECGVGALTKISMLVKVILLSLIVLGNKGTMIWGSRGCCK